MDYIFIKKKNSKGSNNPTPDGIYKVNSWVTTKKRKKMREIKGNLWMVNGYASVEGCVIIVLKTDHVQWQQLIMRKAQMCPIYKCLRL